MSLPDLKELNKLITLCRKRGVDYIKAGDLELQLNGDPFTLKKARKRKGRPQAESQEEISEPGSIESDGLTDDQKLFWSAQDPSLEPATEGNG